jgi:hypothetical protein
VQAIETALTSLPARVWQAPVADPPEDHAPKGESWSATAYLAHAVDLPAVLTELRGLNAALGKLHQPAADPAALVAALVADKTAIAQLAGAIAARLATDASKGALR